MDNYQKRNCLVLSNILSKAITIFLTCIITKIVLTTSQSEPRGQIAIFVIVLVALEVVNCILVTTIVED